jgi:hypothetical protein
MPTPEAASMERALHDCLGRWAQDHADRYPGISVLEYDPDAYPEQRITSAKTTPSTRLADAVWAEIVPQLQERYRANLGLHEREVISALNSTAESVGASRPLVAAVKELLRAGRNVAILAAHADRLEDLGTFCGALAVAMGEGELIRRNGAIVNKVMTREALNGASISSLFELFANVYWVIPETESTAHWGIRPEAMRFVNSAALRAVVADMHDGIALTFAPSGSAMRRTVDSSGELVSLTIPPVASGTAKLLARFDAYVVTSFWEGRVAVDGLTRVGPAPVPQATRAERAAYEAGVADAAVRQLAALTEQLAGVPVGYQPVARQAAVLRDGGSA